MNRRTNDRRKHVKRKGPVKPPPGRGDIGAGMEGAQKRLLPEDDRRVTERRPLLT